MSTSCTSAALAATTSGSSSLARNTTGGTCAASLYASIDLHSDDADLRSGEEVSCEEDKTMHENNETSQQSCTHSMMTPVLQHRMNELPISIPMSMMSAMTAAANSSTRRNKRKNFQPRNIRPNESPDRNDPDNDDKNLKEITNKEMVGEDDMLILPSSDEPIACCSISESKITMISSRHCADDLDERKSRREMNDEKKKKKKRKKTTIASISTDKYNSGFDIASTDESNRNDVVRTNSRSNSSSRNSQVTSHISEDDEEEDDEDDACRNSNSSRSVSSSRNSSHHGRNKNTAVDLRLRPTFNTEDEEDNDDDDDNEEEMSDDVSGLEMKTWMLFWQQQQSCNDKPSFPRPPSISSISAHGQQQRSNRLASSAVNETRSRQQQADEAVATIGGYAETTMRELLGIYGLQRDAAPAPAPAPLDSSTSGLYSNVRAGSPIDSCRSAGQEGQVKMVAESVAGVGTLRTSSTPSVQQPPTPPHTPKTTNMITGQTATMPLGRTSDFNGANDLSLTALQTHMHSILSNVKSSSSTASSRQSSSYKQTTAMTASISDSQTGANVDLRQMSANHQVGEPYQFKAASFASIDLHVEVANDVSSASKTLYNQHELQQLSTTIGEGRQSGKVSSGNGGSGGSGGTGSSGSGSGSGSKSSAPIDYSRYVKRFGSASECGSPYCKDLNYREHFHCLDCHPRVFVKKEEMIRHFKWHKKRDESLQHGFMRYSPGDDCNDRYRGCPHNRKQTHYHCVKDNCDKVYISTSDVQMHANYHRKDSAIIQEGFQRFRATEDCATAYCAFNGQRTTHFHCRRPPCNYTFKNKADMEKHKSYHIKDEQLARDGFKKFMKNEACQFDSCRFSRVCNHIHCIREDCTYVLHSSGQLYSHKRKHERRDAELAYQDGASTSNNNIAAIANTDSTGSNSNSLNNNLLTSFSSLNATSSGLAGQPLSGTADDAQRNPMSLSTSDLSRLISDPSLTAFLYGRMPSLFNQLEMAHLQHRQRAEQEQRLLASAAKAKQLQLKNSMASAHARSPSPVMSEEDAFRLCLAKIDSGKPCQPDCQIYPHEHYHCRSDGCALSFKSTEAAKEHWRNHEQQEQITDNYYISVEVNEQPNPCPSSCPYQTKQRHYHCCWEGCAEIILSTEKAFRRLDHYKMHEYSRRGHQQTPPVSISSPAITVSSLAQSSGSTGGHSSKEITFTTGNPSSTSFSLDSMFRRKRGRPPKNRVIEVWNESCPMNSGSGPQDTPQAIFTSFKLPKPTTPPLVPYSPIGSGAGLFAPPHYGLTGPSHSASSSRSNSSEWKSQRTLSPSPERPDGKHSRKTGISAVDKCVHLQKRNISPSASLATPSQLPSSASLRSPESPTKSITVVKAAGTFYPSSAFPSKNDGLGPRLIAPPPQTLPTPSQPPASVPATVSFSLSHREVSSSSPTPLRVQSSSLSNRSSSLSPSSSSSSISPSPFALSSPVNLNVPAIASSTTPMLPITSEKPMAYGPNQSCGRPFCKLKRREHYHCVVCNQAFSDIDKLKPHMLKHCTGALSPTLSQWAGNNSGHNLTGQLETDIAATAAAAVAASGADRKSDVVKDMSLKNKEEMSSRLQDYNNSAGLGTSSLLHSDASLCADLASRSSAALHALSFMSPLTSGHYGLVTTNQLNGSPFLSSGIHQPIYTGSGLLLNNPMGTGAFGKPISPGKKACTIQGNKRPSSSPVDHLMLSPEAKKMRFQSSMRLLKDEPVPDGYVRFRFNEDCQYSQCGYREHQTHFHCMRPDCGYSFCDKTRFVQHTARHERLDTLMGGDFQQYRANVACGRPGCLYTASLGTVQNKASHFHCLKCDFVCTDTNKVVAHRRQHQKTDSILAAGFEKFTPSQNCRVDSCPHSNKQTHYHCLKCCYAVLGLAQMSAHKYRHLESTTTCRPCEYGNPLLQSTTNCDSIGFLHQQS